MEFLGSFIKCYCRRSVDMKTSWKKFSSPENFTVPDKQMNKYQENMSPYCREKKYNPCPHAYIPVLFFHQCFELE